MPVNNNFIMRLTYFIKPLVFILFYAFISSCGIKKISTYSSTTTNDYSVPDENFNKSIVKSELDYNDVNNWAFKSDLHDFNKLIPKNHKIKHEKRFDVSVFYVHPTSLFDSENWNADTAHFSNNAIIDLCLENQASVFAGICDLYVPHYREMHIHSYTDTINGFKAFDMAYNDVLSAFKYFVKNIKTDKFIIASHSQGTNHAKRLINEFIVNDQQLLDRLILSYLIGMDIGHKEMSIELCDEPDKLYCFLNWRSFHELYYPSKWNYGSHYQSVNPITYTSDFLWSNKDDHQGILLPNKKIRFRKTLSVRNEQGLLWVKFFEHIILKKLKRNSYHNADFNLFWVNIRQNLIERLDKSRNKY